jgi:outer membrane protein X
VLRSLTVYSSAKISANGSWVGTYDYYFNAAGTSLFLYWRCAGYYSIANVELIASNGDVALDASGKMGGLLRWI